jgi:hypothetical protein
MKLTDLITQLFKSSEFDFSNSLANHTGQTQPFTDAFLKGSKGAREKEDILFHALTSDISVEELLSAIDLIRKVRHTQIERGQFI